MTSRTKDTLLLVGDSTSERKNLWDIFESKYYLLEAESAAQAALLLQQNEEYIVAVIADIALFPADHLQSLAEACRRSKNRKIPLLTLVPPSADGKNEEYAFVLGSTDVVHKPYTTLTLQRRVQLLVEMSLYQWDLEAQTRKQNETLRRSNQVMVDALTSLIEYRSAESGNHVLRIRRFTKILMDAVVQCHPEYSLDEDTVGAIARASALHDIGKIAIPDRILNKPGSLTDEEYEVMKTHAAIGGHMVEGLKEMEDPAFLSYAYHITRHHHERWDGQGYPEGLQKTQIPLCAQVVGLADAFDALTSPRVYKEAHSFDSAINMILNGECGAFSPELLECFKRCRDALVAAAQRYADGFEPKAEQMQHPLPRQNKSNLTQLTQLKYQTLLHYVDDTVIEMDLDDRIFHVVYNPNPDFISLFSGVTFETLSSRLFQEGIHPEDLPRVTREYGEGMIQLFRQGSRTFRYQCRLYSPPHDAYYRYEITFQRIITADPEQRLLLIIFHNIENQDKLPMPSRKETLLENPAVFDLTDTLLCCLNDRQLTIREGLESLTPLTGVKPGEAWTTYHNSLLEMVDAEDRERVTEALSGQDMRSGREELEFRMENRDGNSVWVLCRSRILVGSDGMEYCYLSLTDISRLKQREQKLQSTLNRSNIILNQSAVAVYEWDVQNDTMTSSGQWESRFGYPLNKESFSRQIFSASRVHPDDLPALRTKAKKVLEAGGVDVADVRIANNRGVYLWSRIRGAAVCDEQGQVTHVVGAVYDIDELKTDAISMRQQAHRDDLTGLLNKSSTQRKIIHYLDGRPKETMAALLVLDMDNFKTVNDSLGHYYGDAVLKQMGSRLRSLFRTNDVVGRIGGDEFMILMKDVPGIELVHYRCDLLVQSLGQTLKELMPKLPVTVSVGVAVIPNHGTGFTELYRRADEALYSAKRKGKNQFAVYSTLNQYETMVESVRTDIDSDKPGMIGDDALVQFVFRSLYESPDLGITIQELLTTIGRQFHVSRTYIFENNVDNTACSNTFEWCDEGISPEKGNLQNLSYATDLVGWRELFEESGILYCTDISDLPPNIRQVVEPQGIRSMLLCAIMDQGVFRGFIGFDECTANYLWTKDQVNTLQRICAVFAVFVTKLRNAGIQKDKK